MVLLAAYPEAILSNATFTLKGEYSDPDRIELLAKDLFREWQVIAEEHYTIDDYGLSVILREGSLKGAAKILGAIGVLYGAIGQYGSFRAGISQLKQDGVTVAKKVREWTPIRDEIAQGSNVNFRTDAGVITEVDRILERVKLGQLEPQEGRVLILDLLSKYGAVPKGTVKDIDESLRTMRRAGNQLRIEVETMLKETKNKKLPSPPERPRPAGAYWVVEVSSRSRKDEPTVKRKKKRK